MSLARDIADLASVTTRLDTVGGSSGALSNRNLIINGGMKVAQRATSKTGAQVTGYHTLDRWQTYSAATDQLAVTMSQDTSVPSGQGFSNSMKFLTATAETAIASDEEFRFWQKIEAQNLKVLDWGTSDAKQITFSFWVKSSLTGNYALSIYTSDSARQTSKTYTISSADTWEKKTVTFVGDTGSTINLDNGIGIFVNFFLMAGSDNTSSDPAGAWASHAAARHAFGHTASWGTNTAHNFYITGVQLEVGDTATDFEHRSYGDELISCYRYYQQLKNTLGTHYLGINQAYATGAVFGQIRNYIIPMRTVPTVGQDGNFSFSQADSAATNTGAIANFAANDNGWYCGGWSGGSGLVYGGASVLYWAINAKLTADAEL